jgi:hypothetical protein
MMLKKTSSLFVGNATDGSIPNNSAPISIGRILLPDGSRTVITKIAAFFPCALDPRSRFRFKTLAPSDPPHRSGVVDHRDDSPAAYFIVLYRRFPVRTGETHSQLRTARRM